MSVLEQVERLLPQLSPAELRRLFRRVAHELAHAETGVESDPAVYGGEVRVTGTRIPVWVPVQAARLGQSDADILAAYPTLTAAGLAQAQAHARTHPEQIDRDILANEAA